jgi:tellurite methyltransferase
MEKEYWNLYYNKKKKVENPSLFAKFCLDNFFIRNSSLIDLGSGDGRDSIFFNNNGLKVLGIDQSDIAIGKLKSKLSGLSDIQFIVGNFAKLDNKRCFDIVYSRFTLHSISQEDQNNVLNWVYKQLNVNGLFCIEVRGKKNEIYKKGIKVIGEIDAYIFENHYRRFLDFELLKSELIGLGFFLEFSAEEKDFAPFNGENHSFIRIIARKLI